MSLIICRNYIQLILSKNIDNKSKTEEFLLVNVKRTRMKRFRNFENISHEDNDFIQIENGCVNKSSSKTVLNGAELNP